MMEQFIKALADQDFEFARQIAVSYIGAHPLEFVPFDNLNRDQLVEVGGALADMLLLTKFSDFEITGSGVMQL